MEQVYLQRIESSNINDATVASKKSMAGRTGGPSSAAQSVSKKNKKPPAFREFQDRFVDQPEFIHRGEILEFETSKQSGSTSKKLPTKQPDLRKGPGMPSNFNR